MKSAPVLLLAIVACGSPPPEIEPDAEIPEVPDADPTHVRISTGVAADVLVTAPDGSRRAILRSDETGELDVALDAGDTVTAFFEASAATVVDVRPGDHLQLGAAPPEAADTRQLGLSWPSHPQATQYIVSTPAGDAPVGYTSFSALIPAELRTVDVLVLAMSGNETIGWTARRDVPVGDESIALGPFQPADELAVELRELPPEVVTASAEISARVGAAPGWAIPVAGELEYGVFRGTATTTTTFGEIGLRWRIQSLEGGSQSGALSASAPQIVPELLPWVGWPEGDAVAGSAAWTVEGTRPYDGTYVRMQLGATPWSTSYEWHFLLPPGRTSVQRPELPAELAAHEPPTAWMQPTVTLIDALGDATDLRARPRAEWTSIERFDGTHVSTH